MRASSSLYLGLEAVAQRVVVAPFEAALLALALSRLDQVFQAARSLGCGLAALRAATLTLHSKLVLSLARNRQVSEFIFDRSSHFPTGSVGSLSCSFDVSLTLMLKISWI